MESEEAQFDIVTATHDQLLAVCEQLGITVPIGALSPQLRLRIRQVGSGRALRRRAAQNAARLGVEVPDSATFNQIGVLVQDHFLPRLEADGYLDGREFTSLYDQSYAAGRRYKITDRREETGIVRLLVKCITPGVAHAHWVSALSAAARIYPDVHAL